MDDKIQDNRLKKFVGKKIIIISKEHPWYESIGKGKAFEKTAMGDYGLVVDLPEGNSTFIFDFSEIRPLIDEEAPVVLSTEETIEQLAGCNYGPRQIALYLGFNEKQFLNEWNNPDSNIRHHFDKGRLQADFEVNQKLLDNSRSGNITAVQIYEKNRQSVRMEELKHQIFFGH